MQSLRQTLKRRAPVRVSPATIALALALVLAPDGAVASTIVKPNIMIVFDTSGTMLDGPAAGRNGDGSLMCGGTDKTSRVYNLKQGIIGALEQIGFDEANFGLMRFPQVEDTSIGTMYCNPTSAPNVGVAPGQWRAYGGHYYVRGQGSCFAGTGACGAGGTCPAGQDCWVSGNGTTFCAKDCGSSACGAGETCLNLGGGFFRCATLVASTNCLDDTGCSANRFCFEDATSTTYEHFGCRLTTDPNVPPALTGSYGSWFDNGMNQSFLVPVTAASLPVGTKPSSGNFDPGDGNLPAIVKWIDGYESGPGAISDPEIHVLNNTPAGRTLWYTRLYFEKYIKPAGDPKASCRKNVVIFITDDDVYNNNCDAFGGPISGGPGASCTGNSSDFHPEIAACKLYKNDGVKVYVLTNTGAGATNSPVAAAGGTTSAIEVNLTNAASIQAALLGIIAESVPPGESCNCADDNCDGQIDEDFPLTRSLNACSVGVGACKKDGKWGCSATGGGMACIATGSATCGSAALVPGTPTAEVCNGIDDDCNGAIDDGIAGGCTCASKPEICNGADDNCNGSTDEGIPSVKCGLGLGECKQGDTACSGGTQTCVGGTGPTAEVCDGKDNDCDGITDGFSQACYPAATAGCTWDTMSQKWNCVGVCQPGLQNCPKDSAPPHVFDACAGAVTPGVEIPCDGLDNDCNGITDDGVGDECGTDEGACSKGHKKCVGGVLQCDGVGPTEEVCDGLDNNCDGITDNPAGTCGTSIGVCRPGTWKCVGTMKVCNQMPGPGPETCNGLDDDCDGVVDNHLTEPDLKTATACGNSKGICKPGTWKCVAGAKQCVGGVNPNAESCNNLDDDCDGCTDCDMPCLMALGVTTCSVPGAGEACGSDVGECRKGQLLCLAGAMTCTGGKGPGTESCNGLDDDCNGFTDETDPMLGDICYPPMTVGCDVAKAACVGECRFGGLLCVATGMGTPTLGCGSPLTPQPERCDGKDNDCDGVTDNGFDVGADCDNGAPGMCLKKGKKICNAKGDGTTCSVPPTTPMSEVCNGEDDDCDGVVDNLPIPGVGVPCGSDVGECKAGTTVCKGGKIVCEGEKGPVPEICNGLDDNCNGSVDEGLTPPGDACAPPELAGKPVIGECRPGKFVCAGKDGWVCKGAVGPKDEICDGKDNDCDGTIDKPAQCPSGFGCFGGECAPQCKSGEFPCPADRTCVDGYCVVNKCVKVKCSKPGTYCRDGVCIDPCDTANCPEGVVCDAGSCKDCHILGCPQGQVCGVHTCGPDPCLDLKCGAKDVCSNGACQPDCAKISCGAGQKCARGTCAPDRCADAPARCKDTDYCDPTDGSCKDNPCVTIQCLTGLVCIPTEGKCLPDPCGLTHCDASSGERCEVDVDGHAECRLTPGYRPPKTSNVGSGGGGGCTAQCAIGAARAAGGGGPGPGSGPGFALLALFGGLVLRRRPRR